MLGSYINVVNKELYLKNNSPLNGDIETTVMCMFCEQVFTLNDCKILKHTNGEETIVCPTSPTCEGTIHDFLVKN